MTVGYWIAHASRIKAERDALAERVGKLQGVVDKLPKTVDGVPIVPGMILFRLDSSPRRAIWISDCSIDVEGRDKEMVWCPDYCYSKLSKAAEAAEAALAAREAGEKVKG